MTKRLLILFISTLTLNSASAQLKFSGFGQVRYNQKFQENTIRNASVFAENFSIISTFDFNDKTRFTGELAYGERNFGQVDDRVLINQLNIRHEIKPWLKLKAGVLLLPIGLINEYRDPTAHLASERPLSEFVALKDIGIGFTGIIDKINTKYQIYAVNGYSSWTIEEGEETPNEERNNEGFFLGPLAYFQGRQNVLDAKFRTPAIASKVEYYGIKGLKLGTSLYAGKTTSDLYNNLQEGSEAERRADSSIVGMTISTLYGIYTNKGFTARAQGLLAGYSNTKEYNNFINNNTTNGKGLAGIGEKYADLPELVGGFYFEAGYNIFQSSDITHKLSPYVRFEYTDSHMKVNESITNKPEYEASRFIIGTAWQPTNSTIFKVDYMIYNWKEKSNPFTGFDFESEFGKSEFNISVGFNLDK